MLQACQKEETHMGIEKRILRKHSATTENTFWLIEVLRKKNPDYAERDTHFSGFMQEEQRRRHHLKSRLTKSLIT